MTVERKIASVFRLNEKNWMKYANPWSVWTRYSVWLLPTWERAGTWTGWSGCTRT